MITTLHVVTHCNSALHSMSLLIKIPPHFFDTTTDTHSYVGFEWGRHYWYSFLILANLNCGSVACWWCLPSHFFQLHHHHHTMIPMPTTTTTTTTTTKPTATRSLQLQWSSQLFHNNNNINSHNPYNYYNRHDRFTTTRRTMTMTIIHITTTHRQRP